MELEFSCKQDKRTSSLRNVPIPPPEIHHGGSNGFKLKFSAQDAAVIAKRIAQQLPKDKPASHDAPTYMYIRERKDEPFRDYRGMIHVPAPNVRKHTEEPVRDYRRMLW